MSEQKHPSAEHFQSEFLPIESIIIGERFRTDYKNIDELCESIREKGLIHYPSVDGQNNLIAGGRRMAALAKLGWKNIPVTRRHFVTPAQLRELELEENLQRENLSWQEEVNLKNEILKLKQELHGTKVQGRGQSGVSQADVAAILGDSPSNFSLDVNLAKSMVEIPELANCKTKDDARKKLKQLQEQLIVAEMTKRRTSDPKKMKSKTKIADESFVIGDAFANLKNHPSDFAYSYINCDPPYGIDLNKIKKGNESTQVVERNYQEWDAETYLSNCQILARELGRIAPNSYLTFWFGIQWYRELYEILTAENWIVDPVPGIWYAEGSGQTMQPDLVLGKNYEAFFICRRGKPYLNKKGRSNVFHFKKLDPTKKIHPTEKPVELMIEMFNTFSPAGSRNLSPFLGSGVDIMACLKSDRSVVGFDFNQDVKDRFLIKVDQEFKESK